MTGEPVIGQPLTLPAARRLAADIMRQRAMGKDVAADAVAAKKRKKHEHEVLAANSFPAAARDYILHAQRKKQRRWREAARMLGLDETDLKPVPRGLAERWSDKQVAKIDRHDVDGVIDEFRNHGNPSRPRRSDGPTEGVARNLYGVLSAMFGRLKLDVNPVAAVKKPDAPERRDRWLDDDEIVKFWRATEEMGQPFGSLYRLLLLTAARLSEIAEMRWDELKDDGATLSLPKERVKNNKPHDIFLSPAARAIIAAMPRIGDFVFTTTGDRPVLGFSKAKARLDRLMPGVAPFRTHDLRRSTASGLQRLGVPLPVTERILGHVGGSFAGIVALYQRHEYKAERRAALERWADHVSGLVTDRPTSVVPIRGSRR